jgi:hypothetical protein
MFEKVLKYLERMGVIFEEFLVLRLEGKDIRPSGNEGEPPVEKAPTPETQAPLKGQTMKKEKGSVK